MLGKRGRGIREGVRKRNMKDAAVGVRPPSRAYSREKRRKKRKEVPKRNAKEHNSLQICHFLGVEAFFMLLRSTRD